MATEEMQKLAEQMNIALDAFVTAFTDPFFRGSELCGAAMRIAEMRGRTDIAEKIAADEARQFGAVNLQALRRAGDVAEE